MARAYTAAMRAADQAKLDGVHPTLATAVLAILDHLAAEGTPMRVIEGLRSAATQARYYAQGRTTPGARITNANGVTSLSLHQRQLDGWGHAVDCAFRDDPTTPQDETWAESQPWERYGALAEEAGLVWGGHFSTLKDRPHVELPIRPAAVRPPRG